MVVAFMAEGAGEEADDEIIVGIFHSAADGAGFGSNALDVKVFGRDVAKCFPGFETATSLHEKSTQD